MINKTYGLPKSLQYKKQLHQTQQNPFKENVLFNRDALTQDTISFSARQGHDIHGMKNFVTKTALTAVACLLTYNLMSEGSVSPTNGPTAGDFNAVAPQVTAVYQGNLQNSNFTTRGIRTAQRIVLAEDPTTESGFSLQRVITDSQGNMFTPAPQAVAQAPNPQTQVSPTAIPSQPQPAAQPQAAPTDLFMPIRSFEQDVSTSATDLQGVTSSSFQQVQPSTAQPRVAINPGHGGADPGACSVGGICEDEFNLRIAQMVQRNLESKGVIVSLTRDSDIDESLDTLTNDIMNANADAAMLIHFNAASPSAKGPETYHGNVEGSVDLAQDLQDGILDAYHEVGETGEQGRGIKDADGTRAGYINDIDNVANALIEVGFGSNTRDSELLNDPHFQTVLAEKLSLALIENLQSRGKY